MATTTNYSWSTPDDTALVKDGAAAIRSLGTAIDSTVFTNAGAAIAKTIVDAKGDIIAATAADTVSRLAVGTNDQVLTADSSTATGLKWGTISAGSMTLISTTTLSSSTTTISSIPTTYQHLQLVVRNFTPATDGAAAIMRFNGDSGANRYTRLTASTGNAAYGVTYIDYALWETDNTAPQSLNVIDIFDYANTTTRKMCLMQGYGAFASDTNNMAFGWAYGFYKQTDAITSITFIPTTGNFSSGDVLLYGVK
jgi:hypothetical protein